MKKSYIFSFGMASLGGFGILWYKISTDFYAGGDEPTTESFVFPALVLFAKGGISSAFTVNYLKNSTYSQCSLRQPHSVSVRS